MGNQGGCANATAASASNTTPTTGVIAAPSTLLHGYAVTGHVAQGVTVDRAYVLASDGLYREWIYTAMSRGREATTPTSRRTSSTGAPSAALRVTSAATRGRSL